MVKGWCCILLGWLCISLSSHASKPVILASIRPLALIAKEIARDDAYIETLITGAASPHHFSLRISDVKRIQQADLVIWVGSNMEPFLQKPLADLNTINLSLLPGLTRIENDPHFWLEPRNAVLLAQALEGSLAKLLPDKAPELRQRTEQFAASLRFESIQLPPQEKGFIAFHDSLGYLVNRFELHQLAVMAQVPEERIGVKTMRNLLASRNQASCLLVEVGEAGEAKPFAKRLDLPLVKIDILAVDREYQSFSDYFHQLFDSMKRCSQGNVTH